MSFFYVTKTLDPRAFGIITMSRADSEEAFWAHQEEEMLDGSGRKLKEVYEFLFGSEDEEEVRAFLEAEDSKPITKVWKMNAAINTLAELQAEVPEEPLPDFVIKAELMKALI